MKTFASALSILAVPALGLSISLASASLKPPLVNSLEVLPKSLTFNDSRDIRSVLVMIHTSVGDKDVTNKVHIHPVSPIVAVDEDGKVTPLKSGKTFLEIKLGHQLVSIPITVKSASDRPVSFVREVMPILAKAG